MSNQLDHDGNGEARPIVQGNNLRRVYGQGDATVEALKEVSIRFQPGTFTAIMGPSGSGKSTLMHILAGLDRLTSGTVEIEGTEITKLSDRQLTLLRRGKIGFVFQFFNLLPTLTAEENIVLPLKIGGEKIDRSRLDRLLEQLSLKERAAHRPSELSGGQQQRVAIARALLNEPAVVFADEPTGNLDSRSGQEILAHLRHAVDETGQTVVVVTHDATAASFADRVIFLSDGQVVKDSGHMDADQILDVIKSLQ